MSIDSQRWELKFGSVIPVWVYSVVAAVIIWFVSPTSEFLTWISLGLAGAFLLTFCIQLSLQIKTGFVQRSMASVGGSLLVFIVASGAHCLLRLIGG
ncbi:MAG: hypothetical protein IT191_04490 [Microbacteriaceae bacterium]|nr:hypothetical protein [Microbacteriaceae bacterium]